VIVPPGGRVGVLGGGQLGRMLAGAGARMGLDVVIFTDEAESPASRVAAHTIVAPFEDEAALEAFAARVDVVTFEFENVPAAALTALERLGKPVRPGSGCLERAQDRLVEKRFFQELGLATAPFAAVDSLADLEAALAAIGAPAILKTRRFGYDGKGQARIGAIDDARAAFDAIRGAPAILEGFVAFEREVSIVAARGAEGGFAAYPLCENVHENGILRRTASPAQAAPATAQAAIEAARALSQALDYVGVFAIEFFVTAEGGLLANEWAPRVHNSGHWTAEAAAIGQFEQHLRAVCGWPLGDGSAAPAVMENLIGAEAEAWAALARDPTVRLTLYGKREARSGRKMGHWTRLGASDAEDG